MPAIGFAALHAMQRPARAVKVINPESCLPLCNMACIENGPAEEAGVSNG